MFQALALRRGKTVSLTHPAITSWFLSDERPMLETLDYTFVLAVKRHFYISTYKTTAAVLKFLASYHLHNVFHANF